MLARYLLLLLFLIAATNQQENKVGFAYSPNPDAIRCGNYFYYLMKTSTGTSVYSAHTGSADSIETYDATDGVLHNKKAKRYPNNCNGVSFEQLWKDQKAYRLYNVRQPDRSIQNDKNIPDVIQCDGATLLWRTNKLKNSIVYVNQLGSDIWYNDDGSIKEKHNIKCGDKNLRELIKDGKTFNIGTQVAPAGHPSVSMTGRYPDFIRCENTDLYIHFISNDQNRVAYKANSIHGDIEIRFFAGRYQDSMFESLLSDCIRKSMDQLIKEGKAFNLNTPQLECPKDIESSQPKVDFQVLSSGNLDISYSHQPNSIFAFNEQTVVKVKGSNKASNINLQCSFVISIKDKQPPKVECPANIVSKDPEIKFAAKVSDNTADFLSIAYSKAPGSKFPIGETKVAVSGMDESGNIASCQFMVTVQAPESGPDRQRPSLKCPENITQKDPIVQFAAEASDNANDRMFVLYSSAPGSRFPKGVTTVRVFAIDMAQNRSICSFNVKIQE